MKRRDVPLTKDRVEMRAYLKLSFLKIVAFFVITSILIDMLLVAIQNTLLKSKAQTSFTAYMYRSEKLDELATCKELVEYSACRPPVDVVLY